MDISTKKVCFLGDSITEGYGASVPAETSYVGLFKSRYSNAKIFNYGVGGTRIAKQIVPSVCEEHDSHFISRVDEMEENADFVAVFGGTNDYGHGDAPFGMFGDKTENTFCGAVYVLFEKLLVKYPLATIAVFTPLHRLTEEVPRTKSGKPLVEYVDIIKKTAEMFSFPVLDLWSVSGINPKFGKVQEMMMPDGLHPNDLGYRRLFERIDAFIKTL